MAISQKLTAKGNLLSLFFLFCTLLMVGKAQAQWQPIQQLGLTQTPELQLNSLSGSAVNLKSYQGKVIIVNFWASWCEPCREEFVELSYLQEKFGPKGLKVIAVNLAEMKPRIVQFLKGNGFSENSLEILLDRNSIAYKTWKARGLPTSFLINKQGKVESVWIGAIDNADSAEVTGKIEALLRQ
jgi:thiol-disulfide isomerase/thioredoxin